MAIRLYRDTFRHLRPLGAKATARQPGQDGRRAIADRQDQQAVKVTRGCQPPRSFWIRAKQYTPGAITCGICGQKFQPQDAGHQ
jgi:hypothetical protein